MNQISNLSKNQNIASSRRESGRGRNIQPGVALDSQTFLRPLTRYKGKSSLPPSLRASHQLVWTPDDSIGNLRMSSLFNHGSLLPPALSIPYIVEWTPEILTKILSSTKTWSGLKTLPFYRRFPHYC